MISYLNCFNEIKLGLLQKKQYLYIKDIKKNFIILKLLTKYNIIIGFKKKKKGDNFFYLVYLNNSVSYFNIKNLFKINNYKVLKLKDMTKIKNKNSFTQYILSTPKGFLNMQESIKMGVGGKLIFRIY